MPVVHNMEYNTTKNKKKLLLNFIIDIIAVPLDFMNIVTSGKVTQLVIALVVLYPGLKQNVKKLAISKLDVFT